jgi:hypothetical protein
MKLGKEGGSCTDLHHVKTWYIALSSCHDALSRWLLTASSAHHRGTDQHTATSVVDISPPARSAESDKSQTALPGLQALDVK